METALSQLNSQSQWLSGQLAQLRAAPLAAADRGTDAHRPEVREGEPMMTNARATYLDASIATASPARLLVMLLERLVLDVQRAQEALEHGRHQQVHAQLAHAQDIVLELPPACVPSCSEGVPSWPGSTTTCTGSWSSRTPARTPAPPPSACASPASSATPGARPP